MTFIRRWNFDGAARQLSTIDIDTISDPDSDLGSALIDLLTGLVVTGSIPAGGAAGTVLQKLSSADGDASWSDITQAEVTGLVAALATKETVANVAALSAALAAKASQASLDATNTTVASKASAASVTALTTVVAGKADSSALATLTLPGLADVVNTPAGDEDALAFDTGTGSWGPLDLTGRFASVDPSTHQLVAQAAAANTLFGFIIDEGSDPPPGLPLGLGLPIIGFERALPPSLIPVMLDDNFAQAANNVVLTMPRGLDVGEKLVLGIGYSGEVTVPDHFSVVWAPSGAADILFTTKNAPNTTAGCVQAEIEVTTAIPNAATLTITARDISNVAINRVHFIAMLAAMPNTLDDALDQQVNSGSIASSSTMTVIASGPIGADTAQASEVAIGIATWNSGTGGTSRVLGGSNGWQKLTEVESDNGSSARASALFYQVQTIVGRPGLTTLMVASDNATGQACAQTATYKAV